MSGNVPAPTEKDPFRIVRAIRELFEGRSNASGVFTCDTSAASTVVNAPNCGADSRVFLQATTANAAAEVGAGTIYVSAVAQGAFTVTHANSATTGRTFWYRIAN